MKVHDWLFREAMSKPLVVELIQQDRDFLIAKLCRAISDGEVETYKELETPSDILRHAKSAVYHYYK